MLGKHSNFSKLKRNGPQSPAPRVVRVTRSGPIRSRDRANSSGCQVEGVRAVYELIKSKRRKVQQVLVDEKFEFEGSNPLIQELIMICGQDRINLHFVSRQEISDLSQSAVNQGVLAFAEPIEVLSLSELMESSQPTRGARDDSDKVNRLPFYVVLDGVTDPQNFGAIARSALAFGASAIVTAKNRSVQLTPSAMKAAAGAFEYLPVSVVPGIAGALDVLKRNNIWTVGLCPDGDEPLDRISVLSEPVAIVMGSEGSGISRLVRSRCDVVASIVQSGRIGSLNVSAASAIAFYEVSKRRTLQ